MAEFYDLSPDEIKSPSRVHNISYARSVISYIARAKLQNSYKSIAEVLNKRHQTITYSFETIKKELKTNKTLNKEINQLLKILGL